MIGKQIEVKYNTIHMLKKQVIRKVIFLIFTKTYIK